MSKLHKILVILVGLGCLALLGCGAPSWKFVVYGDTRTNDDAHRQVLRVMNEKTPDREFIINVGDVIERGARTDFWERWQSAVDSILGGSGQSSDPPKYMAVPGNHDDVPGGGDTNWAKYLPGQQRFGNNGRSFSFDYNNARFIILNSRESLTDSQKTLLLRALRKEPKQWLFALWHKPVFDFGPKGYEEAIHREWGVPLYEHGADVIFTGHAHYYVRTKKLRLNGEKNPPIDESGGTVQCVIGNGGAPLKPVNPDKDGNRYMLEKHASAYGYTECEIDGDQLTMKHYLSDGTLFDEVTYRANAKRPVRSTSPVPSVP